MSYSFRLGLCFFPFLLFAWAMFPSPSPPFPPLPHYPLAFFPFRDHRSFKRKKGLHYVAWVADSFRFLWRYEIIAQYAFLEHFFFPPNLITRAFRCQASELLFPSNTSSSVRNFSFFVADYFASSKERLRCKLISPFFFPSQFCFLLLFPAKVPLCGLHITLTSLSGIVNVEMFTDLFLSLLSGNVSSFLCIWTPRLAFSPQDPSPCFFSLRYFFLYEPDPPDTPAFFSPLRMRPFSPLLLLCLPLDDEGCFSLFSFCESCVGVFCSLFQTATLGLFFYPRLPTDALLFVSK